MAGRTDGSVDVVTLLLDQHAAIRQLIAEVEAAAPAQRQEPFTRLRQLLAVHETAEEMVVHPQVRIAAGGAAVADARVDEEREAKKVLAAVEDLRPDDPAFPLRFAELRDAVLAHAEAEEREEFPLLAAEKDRRTQEVMAKAVLAAEAIAPTHPHPRVNSATANIMVGPIASVVDRTRDAVGAVLGGLRR
jgi:hemerythrin superfamily protein